MVSLSNITVRYGDQTVLDAIDLTLGFQERIALVGKNGAGKTTLFRIIAGRTEPHEGSVSFPKDIRIGYLEQELFEESHLSVIHAAMRTVRTTKELEDLLARTMKALEMYEGDHSSAEYLDLVQEMTDLNDKIAHAESINIEGKAHAILSGLGFGDQDMDKQLSVFSGGWKMRVELARLLLENPDFLLLDEPTNHLDIEAIIWMENYIKQYEGTVLLISHDQRFLDLTTNRTLELERGKLTDYAVSFSNYLEERAVRREIQEAAYNNQLRLVAQKQRTIDRFRAKASKASMAKSMEKQLAKIELVDVDSEDRQTLNLRLTNVPRSGEVVCRASGLTKDFGEKKVFGDIEFTLTRGEKVAFVGQNGQGKTTLARIIVGDLRPTAGNCQIGYNVHLGYFAQNQADQLTPGKTVLETMESHATEESRPFVRKILGAFLFSGEEVEKKVSVLSGGEKARLAFACMMLKPFNFLVLDEPTNHLDIPSKYVLKQALTNFSGSLIIVSHDREFLSGMTEKVFEFRDGCIKEYLGDVEYFLERRKITDMREIAMKNSGDSNSPKKPAKEILPAEDQKKIKRSIQYIERDIRKLEEKASEREAKMADPEFFKQPGSQAFLSEYQAIKSKLSILEQEWEQLVERLREEI